MNAAADRLLSHSVEALVVIVAHRAALRFIESFHVGVPVVLVGGGLSGMPMSAGVDQALGVRLAIRHLLDLGHETVFHLAGPLDWIEAMARRDAWREELERAGRRIPPVRWGGDWGPGSGYQSGQTLVREPGVTAVFVANDQMALGFLRAVTEAGLSVPEDISVVGFDDIPESLYFAVPIVLATIATTSGVATDTDVFSMVFVLVVVFTLVQAPTLPFLARVLGVAETGQAREVEVESAPLAELDAELIQVAIPVGSRLSGVSVRELRLPERALVTMISRDTGTLVPDSNTVLHHGDRLLIVSPAYARGRVERRLRSVSRGGRLAGWFGERGDAEHE